MFAAEEDPTSVPRAYQSAVRDYFDDLAPTNVESKTYPGISIKGPPAYQRTAAVNSSDAIKGFTRSPETIEQPEYHLSYAILAAMVVLLTMQMALMVKQKKGWGPTNLKVLGIVLVVMMGAFLITAGYSQSQITPMIGILGTLLGYLLGQTGSSRRANDPDA